MGVNAPDDGSCIDSVLDHFASASRPIAFLPVPKTDEVKCLIGALICACGFEHSRVVGSERIRIVGRRQGDHLPICNSFNGLETATPVRSADVNRLLQELRPRKREIEPDVAIPA